MSSKDMEYYRQSDADLAYEQIEMFDKLLKNHTLVTKSVHMHACIENWIIQYFNFVRFVFIRSYTYKLHKIDKIEHQSDL